MTFFDNRKKLLLLGGGIVLLVVLLFVFWGGRAEKVSPAANFSSGLSAGSLVSELSASPADQVAGRDLLLMLSELKSITLDTSIFSDPLFTALEDESKPIEPQPFGKSVGRKNPFSGFGQ